MKTTKVETLGDAIRAIANHFGEPPTVDPLYCALRQLTSAREYLQSAMQQLDDPVLPMLIEDLAIIMQRLSTISDRIGP
jgi:hypothetical protein